MSDGERADWRRDDAVGKLSRFSTLLESRHARGAGFVRTGLQFERQQTGYVEIFRICDWSSPMKDTRRTSACLAVHIRFDDLPYHPWGKLLRIHASGFVGDVCHDAPRILTFDDEGIERVVDVAWQRIEFTSRAIPALLPRIRERAAGGEFADIRQPKRRASTHVRRAIWGGNEELDALMDSMPTGRWRQELDEGDNDFTRAAILESERALSRFLGALGRIREPTRESALPIVEQLVVALNRVNKRHGAALETQERDELCAFIEVALAAVGVRYDGDVTDRLREW